MSKAANYSLLVNPKWKNTSVHDSLSTLQLNLIFDETLGLIDFKTNLTGYCYIPKQSVDQNQTNCVALRKHLAKLHNSTPNISIQALVDYSNKELFKMIQEFAVIELKIQVIPVESLNEMVQYLERSFVTELYDENKNPFANRNMFSNFDESKSSEILLNLIKMMPKVGDKAAHALIKAFKNLKSLSNATFVELSKHIGSTNARVVYDYLHNSQLE